MYTLNNFNKCQFESVGKYDIPAINAEKSLPEVEKWVGFREKSINPAKSGLHFFVDDYRFNGVWLKPDKYIDALKKYAVVTSPDFSMYTDMPKAMQIFSHYKKQWLAAYWQRIGICVIPTVAWADKESFDFCFDGIPKCGVVAVSSVGCMKKREAKENFINGFNEMVARLNPCAILYYGKTHTHNEKIISMGTVFYDKFGKENN